MKRFQIQGAFFVDHNQRKVFFKGINLAGSSKVPVVPDGATYKSEGFFDHRNVSFTGRPFSLAEADEHFRRLRAWGYNLLRFIVTWEAIEHAGADVYDDEYLDYMEQIIDKAGQYGFSIFIDPHQDVWSRFSGGDGAPGWTLEKAGFQIENLHACGAAIVHNLQGDPFPRMVWPTNNGKLAAASMWVLFFAGNDFAPDVMMDGVPAQDYLQQHYIAAMQALAGRLRRFDHVLGYGSMNEPSGGWIGWEDLRKHRGLLKMHNMPVPWQSILLGNGYEQEVEVWKVGRFGLKQAGTALLNSSKTRAWREGTECIWKKQGLLKVDESGNPTLTDPHYFSQVNGHKVAFNDDYLKPFINRYAAAIRQIDPEAMIFIEGEPDSNFSHWGAEDAGNIVDASHWYDGVTLITKNFNPFYTMDTATEKLVFGKGNVKKAFFRQLKKIRDESIANLGGVPTLIGEFGVPFDLNDGKSYRSGDFSSQTQALDLYYQIIDSLFLHSAIWNYTPDNNNLRGDLWNDEDLSIFSRDQQDNPQDIHSGGRALRAVVRPYCHSLAGEPISQVFNMEQRVYTLVFSGITGQTSEIWVPNYQYPQGIRVVFPDGVWEHDADMQILHFTPQRAGECEIRISPRV